MLKPIWLLLSAAIALAAATSAQAQSWPQRPVALVVPQAAGNSPDILARVIADKLSRSLGQQVYVENRTGAANIVGTQAVARATPDGYTFLFATSASLSTNPHTFKKLPYDPLKDLAPVALVARSHHVLLVDPKLPISSLAELIAHEKARPGTTSLAVDSERNISGLIGQTINRRAGIGMVLVPYASAANSIQDTIAGRVQATIQSASVAEPFIKEGTLRPIAVAGTRRLKSLPNVPAIAESLPSADIGGWFMVMAPAGTPPDIIQALSLKIAEAQQQPDVRERAPTLGFDVDVGPLATPAGAAAFLGKEIATMGALIKEFGIEPQ
jgi:tripartite-type tricarboxylate transporter receptor subunit TctC